MWWYRSSAFKLLYLCLACDMCEQGIRDWGQNAYDIFLRIFTRGQRQSYLPMVWLKAAMISWYMWCKGQAKSHELYQLIIMITFCPLQFGSPSR